MRDFLKSFLGSLTAMLVILGGMGMLFLMFVAVATTQESVTVPAKAVLVLDLTQPISDKPHTEDPSQIIQQAMTGSSSKKTVMLRTVLDSIRHAATDDRIVGILLQGSLAQEGYLSGWAALRELRGELLKFKESGKQILSYSSSYGEPHYLIASTADSIVVHPLGLVELNGLASQQMYFANALKKYGVEVQVLRVGKFKAAVEPLTLDHMSDAAREQTSKLLEDMYSVFVEAVSESRGLSPEELDHIINDKAVLKAEDSREFRLTDRVAFFDEVRKDLEELTGAEEGKDFKRIGVSDYWDAVGASAGSRAKDRVAVIFAEGTIVNGDSKTEIGGASLAKLLKKARKEKNVKAVVLRVNSPGGSAYASEVIQRETRLIQEAGKPFVVSMGTVAASGGYWISAFADEIVAQPNTITGSIGVFGLLPNVKKLANNFGVTVDGVKTGRFSDIGTIFRAMEPDERAILQSFTDQIYDQFLSKVAEGRKMDKEAVHEIAQGRVWSGAEAKRLGLVDTLGGLEVAIQSAAGRAGLDDYRMRYYQKKKELQDVIMELLQDSQQTSAPSGPLSEAVASISRLLRDVGNYDDPNGVYARMPFDLTIR